MREECFGVIPLKREGEVWKVLIIQHREGHWTYPKGHKERGETDLEAASRELFEETGLSITHFLPIGPYQENYRFKRAKGLVHKFVTYYPAVVSGNSLNLQPEEVKEAAWVPLEEAVTRLTYPPSKNIASQFLSHSHFLS